MALAFVFFLFPIYWIFSMSVKQPSEYFHNPPVWFPRSLDFDHFQSLVRNRSIDALVNSLVIAGGATLLAVIIGCPAAYSMARFKTGGRNFAFWVLSQRMLPPIAIAFPVFLLFRTLKWVDTYHGLILLYAAFNTPYVIWMMRGYFRDVPVEVEESALVDGASVFRVFWSIALPLSAAGLIATTVFTFIFSWNEFLFAVILTRSKVVTLPVKMSGFFGSESTFWGAAGALSVIASAPIFVLSLLVQKYLTRGLTLGAIK
jgi:multiple sugar transport system permease protein